MNARKLLVFDLDGTLAETAGDLIGTLNFILAREGIAPIDLSQARFMLGAGAKALIHARIAEFAGRGGAVLLSSSDTPELLALSDAIVVMRRGRLAGRIERDAGFNESTLRRRLEADA